MKSVQERKTSDITSTAALLHSTLCALPLRKQLYVSPLFKKSPESVSLLPCELSKSFFTDFSSIPFLEALLCIVIPLLLPFLSPALDAPEGGGEERKRSL